MPNLHPILVHFPIALLTISFLFDALSVALRREQLEVVGRWTQIIGTLTLVAVVVSGLSAKGVVNFPDTGKAYLESHEQLAFVISAFAITLLFWRISNRWLLPRRYRTIYLLVSFATVLFTWIGAWYGGELVYRFGVGVGPH